MSNLRKAIVVASALIMGQSIAANAADLLPPPVVEPVPIPEPVAVHDIYLKGYIGITNQDTDTFTNDTIEAGNFTIIDHNFDSAPFIGLGIGVSRGERFRFDATGEYRGRSDFTGLDTYVDAGCGPGVCTNEHTGIKSEWLFLANAYWDITTFRGFTPYVGAGIGAAEITLESFKDINLVTNGLYWAKENSEWNFAWALHAGFSYEISDDLSFDFGYRYTYLGDGKTGKYYTYDPGAAQGLGELTLEDIDSHDVMVGLRWRFGHDSCCAPEAVPIAYTPPTTYK